MASKKSTKKNNDPIWLDAPEDHDYPAAANYLSLLASEHSVAAIVAALKAAPAQTFAAKDILRASRLPLLGVDNAHVASDLAKVKAGTKLSPVLLVRGDLAGDRPLQIADGYHRVCTGYHLDENCQVPVRIVGM